jgi:hypothetical protein
VQGLEGACGPALTSSSDSPGPYPRSSSSAHDMSPAAISVSIWKTGRSHCCERPCAPSQVSPNNVEKLLSMPWRHLGQLAPPQSMWLLLRLPLWLLVWLPLVSSGNSSAHAWLGTTARSAQRGACAGPAAEGSSTPTSAPAPACARIATAAASGAPPKPGGQSGSCSWHSSSTARPPPPPPPPPPSDAA